MLCRLGLLNIQYQRGIKRPDEFIRHSSVTGYDFLCKWEFEPCQTILLVVSKDKMSDIYLEIDCKSFNTVT